MNLIEMNKTFVKEPHRLFCVAVAMFLSVSAGAQRDFSSIHTGIHASDIRVIESGVKPFPTSQRPAGKQLRRRQQRSSRLDRMGLGL